MKKRYFQAVLAGAAVLLLLLLSAWLLLFRINRFSLSIRLKGEQEYVLEYGETYEEPGAGLLLRGTLFLKEGITPKDTEIQIASDVNEMKLGRYTVTYTANWYWLNTEEVRTVSVIDTRMPVITLAEDPEGSLDPETVYQEAGYTARDNYDGDITDRVIRTESMGLITYAVVDSSGNPAYAEREVPYHDPIPPQIRLEGGAQYAIPTGKPYSEPGYLAVDNVDGDLSHRVAVEGEVDWLRPGTYPITYTVTDNYENTTVATRNVQVTAAPRTETRWPDEKTIYLTFDDGPGPYTQQLLDVLDSYGVKATFFVLNTDYNYLMREIVERGHSIGIHSVTHTYEEIYASPEAYFDDLFRMQQIIYENTGVMTTLMRFPGGSSNEVSCGTCEGIMTLLTEAVQDAGFQYFDWNVDSDDAGNAHKTKTVRNNVLDGIARTGISLVLQHDIHPYSVEAVEEIILWGLENGYTFRPLEPDSPGFHHELNN